MLKSKEIIGLPVINLNEGNQIGKVSDLIIDPATKKVVIVELNEKVGLFKKSQSCLTLDKISHIGSDAVTVENLEFDQDIPKELESYRFTNLVGRNIMLENGSTLGKLGEIIFSFPGGEVTGIKIIDNKTNLFGEEKGEIEISKIRTIGKDVIIVFNH
ncbi:Uncharacterized protein YrrD, contains PRC-barrel domain [Anaerobranca californiensis DSM 14826]|jgi:sporulation protein YlmC with PRC-barrel domain|uniref:Uncharacterized protein YrrD, contains PRC-barrel domain n=1 Tax=Anaerobranca californiensis DSM 14826 TaxID=1120989 RepID=A0A1M6NMM0_9FIRM|nr:PRC-barrel domain-containing protein [Anaerobranca californiensis]SHJ96960.1 Uncharacterized protein YrrD, contains PRC-barrel domain [Anaerobranca californiensis DSM 14826]